MHLHGTLRMADVDDFLSSMGVNVIESCRKIMDSHVLKGKVPKNTLFLSEVLMRKTVLVTTIVSKPNIVASISKSKADSMLFIIDDECIATVE